MHLVDVYTICNVTSKCSTLVVLELNLLRLIMLCLKNLLLSLLFCQIQPLN